MAYELVASHVEVDLFDRRLKSHLLLVFCGPGTQGGRASTPTQWHMRRTLTVLSAVLEC